MFGKKKKPVKKTRTESCQKCNGLGRLTRDVHNWTIPSRDALSTRCNKCGGSGVISFQYYD